MDMCKTVIIYDSKDYEIQEVINKVLDLKNSYCHFKNCFAYDERKTKKEEGRKNLGSFNFINAIINDKKTKRVTLSYLPARFQVNFKELFTLDYIFT